MLKLFYYVNFDLILSRLSCDALSVATEINLK